MSLEVRQQPPTAFCPKMQQHNEDHGDKGCKESFPRKGVHPSRQAIAHASAACLDWKQSGCGCGCVGVWVCVCVCLLVLVCGCYKKRVHKCRRPILSFNTGSHLTLRNQRARPAGLASPCRPSDCGLSQSKAMHGSLNIRTKM